MRIAYKIITGKLEGKRPLEKCRRIWEDKINMGLLILDKLDDYRLLKNDSIP
jgi:hypothetical protein